MPIEVIDLLSSSPEAAPPLPKAKTQPRPRPESPGFSARRPLFSSSDRREVAVIPNTSSQSFPDLNQLLPPPPPPPPITKRSVPDVPAGSWDVSYGAGYTLGGGESVGRQDGISDNSQASKRRRVSSITLQPDPQPQPKPQNVRSDPERSRPEPPRPRPLPQPARSGRLDVQTEVIDLASSPSPPGPSKATDHTLPKKTGNRFAGFLSDGDDDEDSLFVSQTANPQLSPSRQRTTSFDDIDDMFVSPAPGRQRHDDGKVSSDARARARLGDEDVDNRTSAAARSPPHRQAAATVTRRPKASAAAWDPISSSAPEPSSSVRYRDWDRDGDDVFGKQHPRAGIQRTQSAVIAIDDSDDCDAGERGWEQGGDASSEEEFPGLADLPPAKFILQRCNPHTAARSRGRASKSTRPARPEKTVSVASSPSASSAAARPPPPPRDGAKKSAEERAREKEQAAAARAAERERKQAEKERARAEKALEKQRAAALAEVNRIRTDKKVSTPEMLVDLPEGLDAATRLQAETLLQDLDVRHETWASPAGVGNVVKWRRRVDSRYDDDLGRWEPVPVRVEAETYAMVIIPAAEFVRLALGGREGDDASLEAHVLRMRRHFADHTIIYMIEGLALWMRRNRNVRNRQFVSAVRSGLPSEQQEPQSYADNQQQQQNRRGNTARQQQQQQEYINEDTIEDALLQLQVAHGALIHHTSVPVETAQWIAVFTQHISTAPYRRQREASNAASAGFCMESGQVRTGDGPRDTYLRMLQEIGRVTAPVAYGVAAEFATVPALVRGLEGGGALVLQDVRKGANRDGALTDRAVGPSISRRMYKIFLGRDETSMDV